ncbi:uncharacterized protein LOC128997116 [Macrosteles quadrilineatus]|uniref:uncharacterized protein LOC128997116 n=1 Tax=Macrosteles quadrilineatus TaxID=74068 RepID=UPI0023E2ECB8|nr:uncharacterized protein LOC128997116 [Macrosteles quadrilineatus]
MESPCSTSRALFVLLLCYAFSHALHTEPEDTPEGYYAFVESPNIVPPQVRPPPYLRSSKPCAGLMDLSAKKSLRNLCGDLNKGFIPRNPMKQNILGSPYPFDLLKNKTLEFFSKSLPILQADESLPKVTKYQQHYDNDLYSYSSGKQRTKREDKQDEQKNKEDNKQDDTQDKRQQRQDHLQQTLDVLRSVLTGNYHEEMINTTRRIARKFCERGGGVLCMLYRAIQGEPLYGREPQRREDDVPQRRDDIGNSLPVDGPPTPCPAKVEYATPVFARNYQGVWRYVVQIPYEGYFTQTVEITKCLQSKCYYIDGGCLSSPRWLSLLVAEIYYPDAYMPPDSRPAVPRPPIVGGEPPAPHSHPHYRTFSDRAGVPADKNGAAKPHCDGVDDLGCFQVRLYYDWFLVPGSCKCWRPDYFSRYVRRKTPSTEL